MALGSIDQLAATTVANEGNAIKTHLTNLLSNSTNLADNMGEIQEASDRLQALFNVAGSLKKQSEGSRA